MNEIDPKGGLRISGIVMKDVSPTRVNARPPTRGATADNRGRVLTRMAAAVTHEGHQPITHG